MQLDYTMIPKNILPRRGGVPGRLFLEFAEYSNQIGTNLHRDVRESAAHIPHRREISRAAALTLRIASSGHFQIG